jgi:hypothetical protein
MKRALVFLLLGPASVVFTVWVSAGMPADRLVACIALPLFFVTFLVSAIAGLVDGCLVRAVPVLVRAPLTAIAGSALAIGLLLALFGMPLLSSELIPFAIGAALYMGACSLLSHNYEIWRLPARPRHGLSSNAG